MDDDLDRDLDTIDVLWKSADFGGIGAVAGSLGVRYLPCSRRRGSQGPPTSRRSFAWEDQEKVETRRSRPRRGHHCGSLRATLGLVDPRGDPRVHAIVAEKQLPTELLDVWAGWAWAQHDGVLHELEVHTDGRASLDDVWLEAVRSAGGAVVLACTTHGTALVGAVYGLVCDPESHTFVGVSRLSSNAADLSPAVQGDLCGSATG